MFSNFSETYEFHFKIYAFTYKKKMIDRLNYTKINTFLYKKLKNVDKH